MNLYIFGILVHVLIQRIDFSQSQKFNKKSAAKKNQMSKGCTGVYDGKENVYEITAGKFGVISVYCIADRKLGGKPWTVILQRTDGSTDFDRPLSDYSSGFGDPNEEYWIGLEPLYEMTNSKRHELWIRVTNGNDTENAHYDRFAIGSKREDYILHTLGLQKEPLLIDNLRTQMGNRFSAKDKDFSKNKCPINLYAGWWFYEQPQIDEHDCADSYLTGKYDGKELPEFTFHNFDASGVKVTEVMMAIRPFET